jgi:peptidoglycan/xylan/chitin deacetylase (PgdA/CDA1 family)
MPRYPRDFTGYGPTPPDPHWPGGAKIAVQIVLNYEEGGENNILHGDMASEAFLSEIVSAEAWPGQRHWNKESIYEYGARAGFWRLHRMLRDLPVTVYGVATALARGPEQVAAMKDAGLGDREPRAEMDRVQGFLRGRGTRPYGRGDPPSHRGRGRAPARLVHGPDVDAHRAAGRRGGRLRLCRRQLRRRAALLDALRRA